jgi:hypothetical protein
MGYLSTPHVEPRKPKSFGGTRPERRRRVIARTGLRLDPRELRRNLEQLDRTLDGMDPFLRRRVLLVLGELVAVWQKDHAGRTVDLQLEVLSGAVLLEITDPEREIRASDWEALVSPVVRDLVDRWGTGCRAGDGVWVEFRAPTSEPEHGWTRKLPS